MLAGCAVAIMTCKHSSVVVRGNNNMLATCVVRDLTFGGVFFPPKTPHQCCTVNISEPTLAVS